jgi:molybdenum cofactor cytidylyltransferase
MISAVVLAASRFDPLAQPKQFLPLGGKPVLQWVLENALAAELDEVICIVHDLAPVRREIRINDERLFWLRNYAADRGQSTSIVLGLWAANPASEGVMFLPGDQPMVPPELIKALIERFEDSSDWVIAPKFNGEARHPFLFRRRLFPELLRLKGESSGRDVLARHKRKTALIDWPQEVSFLDVAAQENYERLKRLS